MYVVVSLENLKKKKKKKFILPIDEKSGRYRKPRHVFGVTKVSVTIVLFCFQKQMKVKHLTYIDCYRVWSQWIITKHLYHHVFYSPNFPSILTNIFSPQHTQRFIIMAIE
jgi:hypothetical protein